jgi:hypothetical protein
MAQRPANVDTFGMPPLPAWLRNLLIGLVALYLVEVALANVVGASLYSALAWFDPIAAPWQIVTRYLVQGLGSQPVMRLLFDLLLIYFLAPQVASAFDNRQRQQILVACIAGGTLVAGLLGAVGFAVAPAMGWHGLSIALITLFGLSNPEGVIRWNFVFPIPGKVIAWGTGVVNALILLGEHSMMAADDFGVWAGVMAWWFFVGPGARRRQLIGKTKKLERDLRNLQVLPGGRDETFH